MKKQTAVEWLLFELSKNGLLPDGIPYDIHNQAKALEREQTEEAWNKGILSWGNDFEFEQWYNKTYGGDK
jgi:hypothetical protein